MTSENSNNMSQPKNNSVQDTETIEVVSEEIKKLRAKAKQDIKYIDKTKKTAESYTNDLLALKATAEENSNLATAAKDSAEESSTAATENAEVVESNRNSTKQLLADVQKERDDAIALLETIKKHEADAKLIADTAQEKDAKVKQYEQELKDLSTEYEELKKRVEDLLPGATSASLASAFGARKKSFKWPKRFWTALFVCSIGGFIIVGWYVFRQQNITSITEFFLYALKKTPILVAIILLEEFARRQYNITLRLEEDYGYKEVLSRSFEGYRKQMEEIEQSPDAPVSKLSGNLLEAMAQQPGRLIDKERRLRPPSADFIEEISNKVQDLMKKEE